MILDFQSSGGSSIKHGCYRYILTNYPQVAEWEWNQIRQFICYEKAHKHPLQIKCEDPNLYKMIKAEADKLDGTEYIPPVEDAIEEYVYHATDVNAAIKILTSGRLLSATRAWGKTGEQIVEEKKSSGSEWIDTPDFYEYIMFGWGTHLVGDFVVLSENFPSDEDFQKGNFDAGVRFYFRYEDIIKHEGHTFDGYHPIKVKEEVLLDDYLYACVISEQYRVQTEAVIPEKYLSRIHFMVQRGKTLQEWNENVVEWINQ